MLRRSTSIRHTLLVTIGGLTLLIFALVARGTWQAWQRLADVRELGRAALVSDALFSAAEQISAERGIALSLLHAPDAATVADLRAALEESRRKGDTFLERSLDELKGSELRELGTLVAMTEAQAAALRVLRSGIDREAALAPAERDPRLSAHWFRESTALIEDTQDLWMGFSRHFAAIDPVESLYTRFKHVLRIIDDHVGREQAVIGRLIVENASPTPEEQVELLLWHGEVSLGWQLGETLAAQGGLSPELASRLKDAESHYDSLHDMVRDVFYRPGASTHEPFPIEVEFWLELSAQASDSLSELRQAALTASRDHLELLEARAHRDILVRATVLLFALVLCLWSFRVITHRVLGPIHGMVDALLRAAEGAVVALPEGRGEPDEIGKLARVLHAFQRNSEEVRRSARALERHATALERSNRELDDFAYIASHDLKEPLRGIHNHSRFLLEDNEDKLDPDSVRRLTRLIRLSQRMERLINDLLYFSRIGRQELAICSTDLNEVVADIEMTLEHFLEERGARIAVPQPLPTVTCDKTQVLELLRNLVTNAVKYNDAPEKIVEVGFERERSLPDGSPARDVFHVRDNGRGIAPHFHGDIFRIFKRLQASKEDQEEGTGVGLTFVKKIVERHGGRIWVESEAGKGSVFYFTLRGESDDDSARTEA